MRRPELNRYRFLSHLKWDRARDSARCYEAERICSAALTGINIEENSYAEHLLVLLRFTRFFLNFGQLDILDRSTQPVSVRPKGVGSFEGCTPDFRLNR